MKILASGAFVALILGLSAGQSLRPSIDPTAMASGPRQVSETPPLCARLSCAPTPADQTPAALAVTLAVTRSRR